MDRLQELDILIEQLKDWERPKALNIARQGIKAIILQREHRWQWAVAKQEARRISYLRETGRAETASY